MNAKRKFVCQYEPRAKTKRKKQEQGLRDIGSRVRHMIVKTNQPCQCAGMLEVSRNNFKHADACSSFIFHEGKTKIRWGEKAVVGFTWMKPKPLRGSNHLTVPVSRRSTVLLEMARD